MRLTLTCASRYFKRYIERELTFAHRRLTWNPINGWKEIAKQEYYYDEYRPWTAEFKQQNMDPWPRLFNNRRIPVEPIKEWHIFKGDRVEILVGKDKGKHGLINSIIKERNWVYVEGLNCKYEMKEMTPGATPTCLKLEQPLLVTTQVQLVDPADDMPTKIEWKYTEKGEKVRVSVRTGRIIPFPSGYYELEDMANPVLYSASEKDTLENEVLEVTFKPKLCTFEDDINNAMGIEETRKRAKTFWH